MSSKYLYKNETNAVDFTISERFVAGGATTFICSGDVATAKPKLYLNNIVEDTEADDWVSDGEMVSGGNTSIASYGVRYTVSIQASAGVTITIYR